LRDRRVVDFVFGGQLSHGLLVDHDSAWFREEPEGRGIEPCIPLSRCRKIPYDYDKVLYQRHKVENLFAKLRDWRRIAPDTTDASTPSSPQSASQPRSFSGSSQCVLSLD